MRARLVGWGALGAVVLGAGSIVSGPPSWIFDWLEARHRGCLYRVPLQAPLVALTLDDGPDAGTTPLILAELRRHGARATFFLIAGRVHGREQLVHQLVAEGHEVGNHFMQDRPGILLSAGQFARDLEQAHRVLAAYGSPRWARPGAGWYSQAMISTMAQRGYRCVLGSVYPYDATIPSAGFSIWHILRNVRPGAILVLHDGGTRGKRTARVLRAVLPELRRRGFQVVSLSELTTAAETSMHHPICSAIDSRRLLAFGYEGAERIVEPHLCGNNTAGHDALLAWFVRGHSASGARPGWRTYLLTEMRDIRALEETFASARAGYNPNDGSMRVVYCRLPPDAG